MTTSNLLDEYQNKSYKTLFHQQRRMQHGFMIYIEDIIKTKIKKEEKSRWTDVFAIDPNGV
ncbi:hypothetical protein Hanom_Chr10g00943041 [Helianthus anomalus]